MVLIYESKNFNVFAADEPHVSREDGGHIVIIPKERLLNRQALTKTQAIELMKLTILVGEAMTNSLIKQGIPIGRINYQDNGNWGVFKPTGPYLHIHLYGRSKEAITQKYGDALQFPHRDTGFYKDCQPLNQKDIKLIKKEIEKLLKTKYKWS